MLAEFPTGILLVGIIIGVPVLMYLRQLKSRRREKKEHEDRDSDAPEW